MQHGRGQEWTHAEDTEPKLRQHTPAALLKPPPHALMSTPHTPPLTSGPRKMTLALFSGYF